MGFFRGELTILQLTNIKNKWNEMNITSSYIKRKRIATSSIIDYFCLSLSVSPFLYFYFSFFIYMYIHFDKPYMYICILSRKNNCNIISKFDWYIRLNLNFYLQPSSRVFHTIRCGRCQVRNQFRLPEQLWRVHPSNR